MGATTFYTINTGKTIAEAFRKAVNEAQYDYGHGGYSGTIAEKHKYIAIAVPDGVSPHEYARQLVNDGDKRINDKWGPAGAVRVTEGKWLFFGWASS